VEKERFMKILIITIGMLVLYFLGNRGVDRLFGFLEDLESSSRKERGMY